MVEKKIPVGTIDMTPTWSALLPAMIDVLADVGPASSFTWEKKDIVREELVRMAQAADCYIAAQKNPTDAHHTAATLIAEIATLRQEKAELVKALSYVRGRIDVSVIRTTQKATAYWEEVIGRIEAALKGAQS